MKKAILLVSFGSGNAQSSSSLLNFEKKIAEKFEDCSIRWAFTSEVIRARLTKQKEKSDSVTKALKKLELERFDSVIVQSLHLIQGQEYKQLVSDIAEFQKNSKMDIILRPALLSNLDNIQKFAKALLEIIPNARQKEDLVLFMAHGTSSESEQPYFNLMEILAKKDPKVVIGTMKGTLNIDYQLKRINSIQPKNVFLMPLLVVLGKHSIEDMAGSKENSWLSRIQKEGYSCYPIVNGLIEYPQMISLWGA